MNNSNKIAIIVNEDTMNKCTGKGCLAAFFERKDSFENYGVDAKILAFTHDQGEIEKKIEKLKKLGVEVVHLSSCLRKRQDKYIKLAQMLKENFQVVGYTHGSDEKDGVITIKFQKK